MVGAMNRSRRQFDSGRVSSASTFCSVAIDSGPSVSTLPLKPRSQGRAYAIGAVAVALLTILGYFLRPTLPPPRITGYTQITHDGQQKSFMGQATDTALTDGPRLCVPHDVHGLFVIAPV